MKPKERNTQSQKNFFKYPTWLGFALVSAKINQERQRASYGLKGGEKQGTHSDGMIFWKESSWQVVEPLKEKKRAQMRARYTKYNTVMKAKFYVSDVTKTCSF